MNINYRFHVTCRNVLIDKMIVRYKVGLYLTRDLRIRTGRAFYLDGNLLAEIVLSYITTSILFSIIWHN